MTAEVGAVYRNPIRNQVSDGPAGHARQNDARGHVRLARLQSIRGAAYRAKYNRKCSSKHGRSDLLLPDDHPEVKKNNRRLRGLALRRKAKYNLCDKLLAQAFSCGFVPVLVDWLCHKCW